MKYIAFFFAVSYLFSSCSTSYYYSSMNSNNPYSTKTREGNFITDAEDIAISYAFIGENGAVKVTVENKSDNMVYIDWINSRIILDNNASNSLSYGDYLSSTAEDEYIYPHSTKSRKFNIFSEYNFHKIKGKFKNKQFLTTKSESVELPTLSFTEANSPLFFTSELSIYKSVRDSLSPPTYYAQDFYVAELSKGGSDVKPSSLGLSDYQTSNLFYTKREIGRGFWTGVGGVILLSVIIVGAIVGDVLPDDYEDDY